MDQPFAILANRTSDLFKESIERPENALSRRLEIRVCDGIEERGEEPRSDHMRILVEPSDYVFRNVGDMAMLHVATQRLARLWPSARIEVLTDEPTQVRSMCPSAIPLSSAGRTVWLRQDFLPSRLARFLSKNWPSRIRRYAPQLVAKFQRRKFRRNEKVLTALASFTNSMEKADLVVVAGMGGITDYFPEYAIGVLETLNLALSGKSRIALVGQGIGPLENTELRARAAAILPKVDLIGLREKRASAPLLHALGVPSDRIVATGDDAIEMAHEVRQPKLGTGIGINLRIANYSGVDSTILDGLSRVLYEVSNTFLAPLVPVPISRVPGEADLVTIRCLMPESAAELKRAAAMRTPLEIVRQIQRCRVVVTGSYHAGVFALANGIPTVGLAGNAYYVDKFRGLADMFGSGCEVVLIKDKDKCHLDILRSALQQLWHAAPDIRPGILASAEEQIAAGHAAYRRLYELVMAKQAASSPHP